MPPTTDVAVPSTLTCPSASISSAVFTATSGAGSGAASRDGSCTVSTGPSSGFPSAHS